MTPYRAANRPLVDGMLDDHGDGLGSGEPGLQRIEAELDKVDSPMEALS